MQCVFDDSADELFVIMNRIWGGSSAREHEPVQRNADGLELAFEGVKGKKWFNNDYIGFHLFLFVAGPIWNQDGDEGPRRLSNGRNPKSFRIDLVVPMHAYMGKTAEEFRSYFYDSVAKCMELMLARAARGKHMRDEAGLQAEIRAGLERYLYMQLPPFRPLRIPPRDIGQ